MDPARALARAQRWLRDLAPPDLSDMINRYPHLAAADAERELRVLAEQAPGVRPFSHSYHWASFRVTGI